MSSRIAIIAFAVLVQACHIGPSPDSYALAQRPNGAAARLELLVGGLDGELLAATDTGLVVMADGNPHTIWLVPFATINSAKIEGVDGGIERARPSGETLAALRRVSRFPQGISPAVHAELLAANHQTEFELVVETR